jgi:poly-gamma-glutamate capsule biosynthesis protein CapA/YwtB (metallophosphatase superfamily)
VGRRRAGGTWRGSRRRAARAALFAAVLAVLAALVLIPASCGPQQPDGRRDLAGQQTGEREAADEPESTEEPPRRTAPEPQGLLVPIAHLTSPRQNVTVEELSRVGELAVPEDLGGEVGELLGRSAEELRGFGSVAAVIDHVSRTPDAVGLVPWDAVTPRVKALAVDGEALLGPGAVDPESYPLKVGDAVGPDREGLRRIVVGGDIVLDRGQSYMAIDQGMGIDFALAGGYAAITSRMAEESQYSESGIIHQFTAERQTAGGEVREYLRSADLTLANFENPVIRDAVYHPDATTFTGDLQLLPIVTNAGIDGVTLGNNHILDAGADGLQETLGHLEDAGIRYTGAGMDLASAREPMLFDLGGVKVGVLNYQGVPSYDWAWATQEAPGTAPMEAGVIAEDIERLRPEVDLLVVMPHWGNEYLATPEPDQVGLAHRMMEAGADLIVGDHAHWPKGIEMYEGKPIFYGTGNFLFDQSWSEETSTGIFVEATLYEDRVVQARPVPFIVLDYAQPNFLVPEAGGNRALKRIFSASLGPEFEAYKAANRE